MRWVGKGVGHQACLAGGVEADLLGVDQAVHLQRRTSEPAALEAGSVHQPVADGAQVVLVGGGFGQAADPPSSGPPTNVDAAGAVGGGAACPAAGQASDGGGRVRGE